MADVPSDLLYTKTHEWAKRPPAGEAGQAHEVIVGITFHAQEELRDVVFVELPKAGKTVKRGEPAAVIESVKAAFDIYAPISGTITRVNDAVAKSPQLVNQDCYGSGWLFALTPTSPTEWSSLLSPEAYVQQVNSAAH